MSKPFSNVKINDHRIGHRRPLTAVTAAFLVLFCGVCMTSKSKGLTPHKYPEPIYKPVQDSARPLHYRPKNGSFFKVSGTRRFNRALYGTHTAFRVEGGDLPEFSFYLPGMGGNIRMILQRGSGKATRAIWLTGARLIETTFDAGHLGYSIKDRILGNGELQIDLYALADKEGAVFSVKASQIPEDCRLVIVYGGASAQRFSRNGDIGADPESSFYFKQAACQGNEYELSTDHAFRLQFTDSKKKNKHTIQGFFPESTHTRLIDASYVTKEKMDQIQADPSIQSGLLKILSEQKITNNNKATESLKYPALLASFALKNDQPAYCSWLVASDEESMMAEKHKGKQQTGANAFTFDKAKAAAKKLGNRIRIQTPDPYINGLGGVLSAAADAIWESPTYLHGAVAWRMRLPAWRGPYAGDALGWHHRAKLHFTSYAKSQVLSPATGPVVFDSSRHHARQLEKMGTSMFSAGYICRNPNGDFRPHHYDMNLVYMDQLIQHFNYTGDTALLRNLWPVITRSLAWENRNFDPDGDGLYDAYACIWASDALQYSGGAVTHSTAYNYRANLMAAKFARILSADPAQFQKKADQIKTAIHQQLWIPKKGIFAEYKDYQYTGNQPAGNLHTAPGLWTIYHSLDAGIADPFQSSQLLHYVDTKIPHIPVSVSGLKDSSLYLLSTTNWQPYTWSVNNVALAENLHMALGYWQGNRPTAAFRLWRSALMESMYMGASPGGFEQLSYYDARRGELYRDFGDPIGIAARSLMEGLFGCQPSAMTDTLFMHPGFPADWPYAQINSPDIDFSFEQKEQTARYVITPHYPVSMALKFQIPVYQSKIDRVIVNGKEVNYQLLETIGRPALQLRLPAAGRYDIQITWAGQRLEKLPDPALHFPDKEPRRNYAVHAKSASITGLKDPQGILDGILHGHSTKKWPLQLKSGSEEGTLFVHLQQSQMKWWQPIHFTKAEKKSPYPKGWFTASVQSTKPIDLRDAFNDQVTNIFREQYKSPRAATVSLQLPEQGIGNWCYPNVAPNIDDSGLRRLAGNDHQFSIGDSLTFATPSMAGKDNIIFVSRWDCYPTAIKIPVQGRAAGLAVMMTGTTNPMQSQMENGALIVRYQDGSMQHISLRNPETWWPIEQDYYNDGLAFSLSSTAPVRVHLKTGKITHGLSAANDYQSIKGFSDRVIDGGAATVLQWKIDPNKKLKSITVRATANEVVIGLMSLSLINPITADSK